MHPIIRAVMEQTDQDFWKTTGYRPGRRLDYRNRDDAAMIPVWLMMEHVVLVHFLTNLRDQPDADQATIQVLADYKHKLDRRFNDDPGILQRARTMMAKLEAKRRRPVA